MSLEDKLFELFNSGDITQPISEASNASPLPSSYTAANNSQTNQYGRNSIAVFHQPLSNTSSQYPSNLRSFILEETRVAILTSFEQFKARHLPAINASQKNHVKTSYHSMDAWFEMNMRVPKRTQGQAQLCLLLKSSDNKLTLFVLAKYISENCFKINFHAEQYDKAENYFVPRAQWKAYVMTSIVSYRRMYEACSQSHLISRYPELLSGHEQANQVIDTTSQVRNHYSNILPTQLFSFQLTSEMSNHCQQQLPSLYFLRKRANESLVTSVTRLQEQKLLYVGPDSEKLFADLSAGQTSSRLVYYFDDTLNQEKIHHQLLPWLLVELDRQLRLLVENQAASQQSEGLAESIGKLDLNSSRVEGASQKVAKILEKYFELEALLKQSQRTTAINRLTAMVGLTTQQRFFQRALFSSYFSSC